MGFEALVFTLGYQESLILTVYLTLNAVNFNYIYGSYCSLFYLFITSGNKYIGQYAINTLLNQ